MHLERIEDVKTVVDTVKDGWTLVAMIWPWLSTRLAVAMPWRAWKRHPQMPFRNNAVWHQGPGDVGQEPCCSRCFEVSNRVVHLHRTRGYRARCPECGTEVTLAVLRPLGKS